MFASAYRILTDLGSPFIGLYLLKRRAEGREDKERFGERFGRTSYERPLGRLIWCHAASVGEATSLLVLIDRMHELYPSMHILVTTGTVTSAKLLSERLSKKAIHQYIPVDRVSYIKRFLDHWQPDFVLLIESEIWPNLIANLRERMIPTALLNARMSDRSFRRWYRAKNWARELMGTFVLCLTQTEDERGRFVALGAKPVRTIGNLKYAAKVLPADESELARLRRQIGERPLWLMASSHRGEEDMACEAHKKLREAWPRLLTIIVPRHPTRGNEIAERLKEQGVSLAQRSKKEDIGSATEVYLADTMGELGLFYRLSPLVILGGSFVAHGGHNPIEPAQLGCAIIFGPHMFNFAEMAREFVRSNAALQLNGTNELTFALDRFLKNPDDRRLYAQAARMLADQKRHVLDQVMDVLAPWFSQTKKAA